MTEFANRQTPSDSCLLKALKTFYLNINHIRDMMEHQTSIFRNKPGIVMQNSLTITYPVHVKLIQAQRPQTQGTPTDQQDGRPLQRPQSPKVLLEDRVEWILQTDCNLFTRLCFGPWTSAPEPPCCVCTQLCRPVSPPPTRPRSRCL